MAFGEKNMDSQSWRPTTQAFIAVSLVIAMIALVFVLSLRPESIADSDMLKMVVGGLMTTGFATIINFYFGSSQGSKDKDEMLITAATGTGNGTVTPPPPPVAPAPAPAPAQPTP